MLHGLPVYWLENAISQEENHHLKALAEPLLKRSFVEGNRVVPERTSSSAILPDDDITSAIKARLATLCGYPAANVEALQVVKYEPGQEYRPHHDYLGGWQWAHRHVTYFVYLNECEGGETEFIDLGLRVKPKTNAALLWYNVLPSGQPDSRTLHAGRPPTSGQKWGLNVWIRG